MLDTLTVYLAGPILGTSYQECTTWREYVQRELEQRCVVLSPMRGKEHLNGEEPVFQSYESTLMSNAKAIVALDKFDVLRSDVIFVSLLGATDTSVGTMIELGWATGHTAKRRIIITALGMPENHRPHRFIEQLSDWIVPDLDTGIAVIKNILVENQ